MFTITFNEPWISRLQKKWLSACHGIPSNTAKPNGTQHGWMFFFYSRFMSNSIEIACFVVELFVKSTQTRAHTLYTQWTFMRTNWNSNGHFILIWKTNKWKIYSGIQCIAFSFWNICVLSQICHFRHSISRKPHEMIQSTLLPYKKYYMSDCFVPFFLSHIIYTRFIIYILPQ